MSNKGARKAKPTTPSKADEPEMVPMASYERGYHMVQGRNEHVIGPFGRVIFQGQSRVWNRYYNIADPDNAGMHRGSVEWEEEERKKWREEKEKERMEREKNGEPHPPKPPKGKRMIYESDTEDEEAERQTQQCYKEIDEAVAAGIPVLFETWPIVDDPPTPITKPE